jgi:hypothetical protein
MTPSELKARIEATGEEQHFFDRKTMRFFGDTMRNYGVRQTAVTKNGELVEVWELYRKNPVKHGNQNSAYFRRDNFLRVCII